MGTDLLSLSPVPPPSPAASSPPAPTPGLWDRERAEGLALHTNVLSIVKAPLCQRAPLRRLWGGHNGGSVPEFPQTVTCFQSLPPTTLHPPQCPEGPESVEEGRRGVGPGPEGMGRRRPPPTFPDKLGRWAFDGPGCGGHKREVAWLSGGGSVCGRRNAGSVGPQKGKGPQTAHSSFHTPRPLGLWLPTPSWAHICRDTQAHTHVCSPTRGSQMHT